MTTTEQFLAEQQKILGEDFNDPLTSFSKWNETKPKRVLKPHEAPYICDTRLGGCGRKFISMSPASARFATGNTVVCGGCGKRKSVCYDQHSEYQTQAEIDHREELAKQAACEHDNYAVCKKCGLYQQEDPQHEDTFGVSPEVIEHRFGD